MKLQVIGLLLVAGFGVATLEAAQARPVFTGTWKFVADKSTPANPPALGAEFRATHGAMALVLELPVTELITEKGRPTRMVDAGLGAPMSFQTDGTEHVMEPRDPMLRSDNPNDRTTKFNYIAGGPYRVSWRDSTLVISSSDHIPITTARPAMRTEVVHYLRTTTFSMTPDGTLVVERASERDPADKGQIVVAKTTLKSVYRKAS